MKQIKKMAGWIFLFLLCSCDYLDVVPDNVATIDNAFTMRSQAEKYLFTCYSYMPDDGNVSADPAMEGGDEMWRIVSRGGTYFNIARGYQNVSSPYGDGQWTNLYKGLRDCNIFLENIGKVPDMDETERRRWISEVLFLKAYYHYYLVRMYGPIPLIKENLPISAGVDEVKVMRSPVDSCFHYITSLIDSAYQNLPLTIDNPQDELGRITQTIALAFKAKVLVVAASPLFNGNADQATLKNPDGTALFNPTYSKAKWDSAVVACRQAITLCHQVGFKLYQYKQDFQQYHLTETILTQMSVRNSVCKKWNNEIIWGNTQSIASSIQTLAIPVLDLKWVNNYAVRGELSPPLKIAELFYTEHGVPITEDKTWDYNKRYTLRTGASSDKLYVREGYTTAALNFGREPRYYADLGFDGGVWYGQGVYDDSNDKNLFYVMSKRRQVNALSSDRKSVTGYFIKKLIHFETVVTNDASGVTVTTYPWPIIRLSDLYLLYAEALDESEGPVAEAYQYINLVRERAGLPTVESSWTNYSTSPAKYTTQDGLREIIQRERLIEFAFEGQRFWDLRRWKKAIQELNASIQGWDVSQETAAAYYRPVTLFEQKFGSKDYFWPIKEANITTNRNLVQNLGW